jgi:hypothetical protein
LRNTPTSTRSTTNEDGDGRYDVLEIETRGPFRGPRVYDGTGLPLHHDNQSIFKERIYLDKANSNVLHNEITVIDHALTRPWTVDKQYLRNRDPRPIGRKILARAICTFGSAQRTISSAATAF